MCIMLDQINDYLVQYHNCYSYQLSSPRCIIIIQVVERKQKVRDVSEKLKEYHCIMKPLEEWLKEAEQTAKKLSVVAKSKPRLEKQLYELKVSM